MKKDLFAYVRVDSTGRIVPGSLILRKKPIASSGGTFVPVTTYQCCTPGSILTVAVPTVTGDNTLTIHIISGGLNTGTINTGTTTASDLVDYLNTNYSATGSFVLSGTNVLYTPIAEGTTLSIGQALDGTSVTLPTLSGGTPNYHIELENGAMTTGDIDTGTTTPATLQTYLTTNYAAEGTYTLNTGNTAIIFKAAATGTTLTITAGA